MSAFSENSTLHHLDQDMVYDSTFDDIIEEIGNSGKFQKRFNFIFNSVLVFFATLIYMNIIYALIIPDHWCHVPGRELTNYSLDEWKTFTIPRSNESTGRNKYSKCTMYKISPSDIKYHEPSSLIKQDIVDCQNSWDYDHTWYKKTAPSQENWVCEKELNVANSLAVAKIGEVIGTLIFGQLGDKIGRKKVFFVTIIIITIGQSSLTVTSHNMSWFLLFMFIGNSTTTMLLVSPLIISMEISSHKDRTYIAMLQRISWTIALCSMPLIMWVLGDWVPFMLITTLPCAIFLFSNRFIIESPRWLAGKRELKRCINELKKIAIVNGTRIPEDLEARIRSISSKSEKVYGIMSLFSSWNLIRNGGMVVSGWVVTQIIYLTLTLNVANLSGNPFLNYFFQGLAELPAYIIGKYSCDYFGRRWTSVLAFMATSFGSLPIVFLILNPLYDAFTSTLTVFLKFAVSLALYTVQLQALEIFPTCIRQTGQSVGLLTSNVAGILGPYIVYLGTSVNASYPYLVCVGLGIIGVFTGFLLPETLNVELPETLADAKHFGAHQKYFSVKYRKPFAQTNSDQKD